MMGEVEVWDWIRNLVEAGVAVAVGAGVEVEVEVEAGMEMVEIGVVVVGLIRVQYFEVPMDLERFL
jgi:hypothetical protein